MHRMGVASVAGMYCLGAAAFPVATNDTVAATSAMQKIESLLRYPQAMTRASTEFELGLVFLLLALTFLADWFWSSRSDCLLDLFCCLLLLRHHFAIPAANIHDPGYGCPDSASVGPRDSCPGVLCPGSLCDFVDGSTVLTRCSRSCQLLLALLWAAASLWQRRR